MKSPKPSRRKKQAGPSLQKIKDKELTKRKLIDAVGATIRKYGYLGIGVNKIAREAHINKKLIYRYFGTPEKLIEEYVLEKDFWMLSSCKPDDHKSKDPADLSAEIVNILENQFDFFYSQAEMQQLIIWEITGSPIMKSISTAREHLGEKFMALTDDHFKGTDINFRNIGALLSAGIYYMVLHAPVGDYCGINLNRADHRKDLKRTVRQIIKCVFQEAQAKKRPKQDGN